MTRRVHQEITCDVPNCHTGTWVCEGTKHEAYGRARLQGWHLGSVGEDRCPDHKAEIRHWGNGVGGVGQAEHKGTRKNCPAPECGR